MQYLIDVSILNLDLNSKFYRSFFDLQPTEATLQTCEESGTDLAQEVKKAILKQKRSSGVAQYVSASNVEQVQSNLFSMTFSTTTF